MLVLGLTFKENCPDLRNSRVIDVVRELASFGANVHVHDPVADKDRASFCEWFTFARRVYQPKGGRDRATEARDTFKKLFGN